MRVEVLDAISVLQSPNATLLDLGRVDRVLDLLQDHGFNLLCGKLRKSGIIANLEHF
jgi:hypothetical protein